MQKIVAVLIFVHHLTSEIKVTANFSCFMVVMYYMYTTHVHVEITILLQLSILMLVYKLHGFITATVIVVVFHDNKSTGMRIPRLLLETACIFMMNQ